MTDTIAGMKIILKPYEAETMLINRTWKERLFTMPFRPAVKFKNVEVQGAKERNNQCIQSGGELHCPLHLFEALKKATAPSKL